MGRRRDVRPGLVAMVEAAEPWSRREGDAFGWEKIGPVK